MVFIVLEVNNEQLTCMSTPLGPAFLELSPSPLISKTLSYAHPTIGSDGQHI